jgi:hypothetical protein
LTSSAQRFLSGLGMRQCLNLPEFWRYVLTKRGHSLFAFLQVHLAAPNLSEWMRQESAPHSQTHGSRLGADNPAR